MDPIVIPQVFVRVDLFWYSLYLARVCRQPCTQEQYLCAGLCYEMVLLHSFHLHVFRLLKLYYCFLSILSLVLLDLILFRGFILFLKDIFHLIGIWSCGHYYKVQGWTHGKHMPDTCLPHVVHIYYCALLCNTVCTAFSIVLLISFHLTCTASSFHLPIMHSTY